MSERRPQTETELIEFMNAIDVGAPQALHEHVRQLIGDGATSGGRSRWPRLGWPRVRALRVVAAAPAVLAAVLVVALSSGGSGRLTVSAASALTLRAATMAAPATNLQAHGQLREAVDGLAFPDWGYAFGFRASGARRDRIDGHEITTVFYTDARGRRVGYAITGGGPVAGALRGQVQWRAGTPYGVLVERGAQVVTWVRAGHLCVVAARGVSSATLLALASWRGEAA